MFETLGLIQSLRTLYSYQSWGPYDEPHGLLDAVCLDRVIMHNSSRVPGRYMAKAEKQLSVSGGCSAFTWHST